MPMPEDGPDTGYSMSDNRHDETSEYVDEAMYQSAPIDEKGPRVFVLWATPDPLGAIAAMCMMYEGNPVYNLDTLSAQQREHYWLEVQKTHLKAPLESVKMHFFIEGVTRAFTHQMVRQRTAVYAQESLRFAVKEEMAVEAHVPATIGDGDNLLIWNDVLCTIQQGYNQLIANGVPAEDARELLPHATTTRLHYVTDLRNLLEHAGNRLCTQAAFEWRAVFLGIMDALEAINWQWKYIVMSDVFKPICFQLGKCPFTADFDRKCTIRERVQAGRWEEIHSSEYLADPTAGRRD